MSSHVHLRRRVRIAAAGLCAALGIGLLAFGGGSGSAGAVGAQTVPSPYADKIGLCTRAFWLSADEGTALYRRLVNNGVTTTREDFSWEHTEPTRGNWDWSRGDNMFTAASRTGMDILVILDYAAPWAAQVPGNFQSLPSNISAYANYSREVVRRYGPGGTFWAQHPELNPQPVRTVEVFNEPWGYWGWPGEPDPAFYARMSRATTEAVHAENPDVDVLISGDLLQARRNPYDVRGWISAVLDADPGLGQIIDGYSIHPYHMGGPNDARPDPRWDYSKVEQIRRITAAHGANKPFWITELGYSTARNVEDGVSETTQARYIRESITRAFSEWPYVKRYYYYSYQRDSGDPNDAPGGMGLIRADGSMKPGWTTITNMLAPRTVTTSTTAPPTTTTAPPATTSTTTPPTTNAPAVLGPARLAVRVLGRVFYYNPAPT